MIDFKKLYFPDPTFDIGDVLTTIGVKVTVGGTQILWAYAVGDLGGTPAALDATPLSASVRMQKAGLQEIEQWELSYYMNDDDRATLDAAKSGGNSVAIAVQFSDGLTYSNNGVCVANYPTGVQVGKTAEMKAVFNLSNPNGWTTSSNG